MGEEQHPERHPEQRPEQQGSQRRRGAGRQKTRATAGPRDSRYVELTPWAHLIAEYAYRERTRAHPRPLSAAEIGVRCGYGRHTVNAWLSRGVEPPISTMLEIIAQLGISVEELIRVYAPAGEAQPGVPLAGPAAGTATVPVVADGAAQRRTQERVAEQTAEQVRLDAAEWALSLASAEESLREAGLSDGEIARVVEHMRAKAQDRDTQSRLRARRAQEWHVAPASPPAETQHSTAPTTAPSNPPGQQSPTAPPSSPRSPSSGSSADSSRRRD